MFDETQVGLDEGFQTMIFRLKSGKPIPVVETSIIVTPNGRMMTISEPRNIIFED